LTAIEKCLFSRADQTLSALAIKIMNNKLKSLFYLLDMQTIYFEKSKDNTIIFN